MKIRLGGMNYEGALFRGIFSETDQRNFLVTVEGEETDICTFILDQLSYGQNEEDPVVSIRELAKLYKEWSIPNGDGCGGVWLLELDGEVILDLRSEFVLTDEQAEEKVQELKKLVESLGEDSEFINTFPKLESPIPIELPPINLNENRPEMNQYVADKLGVPSLRDR